ncbi:hypothetical protein CANCADRAFT_84365 [Tortispora caseinolytica NRRL Y-17796]|uniref:Uncharacterized protein n=1 Tax=Tortispora caseinolytica NRRL Y-17796 TaxID=767744 RepID=A0A1E4TKH5_9ASCO|nr:hypothetical protein CANCADRAFT_84365 [Tortispora caseinolytica NRRL Y-17796]
MLKTNLGTTIYQVAGANTSRSLPEWIARKKKRELKEDLEYANRIELIQDFEFEEASNRLKISQDGEFIMATGTYKPQLHVYDLANLSMKFTRHTDAENVDFEIISDDWTKSVHLQNDRWIEFQAQGGIYTRTRIPRFGRSLAYDRRNCDLYVAAAGAEVYRLNLDQGKFLSSAELGETAGVNDVIVNEYHGLVACGTEEGVVEFFDSRTRPRPVAALSVGEGSQGGVSKLAYKDGLTFAAGTGDGYTIIWDLRKSTPLMRRDQGFGFAINTLEFVGQNRVMSGDRAGLKLWEPMQNSQVWTVSVEGMNDAVWYKDSGMVMTANEGKPMHAFYIPALGPAPKWCSFIDSITEEMEESGEQSVYQNYRFVTRRELAALGLDHLKGTKTVRAYMHGFFIDQRLYDQAKLLLDPNSAETARKDAIRKKMEAQRASRIRAAQPITPKAPKPVLQDSRFAAVLDDEDYAIDESK